MYWHFYTCSIHSTTADKLFSKSDIEFCYSQKISLLIMIEVNKILEQYYAKFSFVSEVIEHCRGLYYLAKMLIYRSILIVQSHCQGTIYERRQQFNAEFVNVQTTI